MTIRQFLCRLVVGWTLTAGATCGWAFPLTNLSWRAYSSCTRIDGSVLYCIVSDAEADVNGLVQAFVTLPEAASGRAVRLRVRTGGGVVRRRARLGGGFRVMLDYADLRTGKGRWMNASFPSDRLEPGVVEGVFDLSDALLRSATVTLGLERSSGDVSFDLSTLELEVFDPKPKDDPAYLRHLAEVAAQWRALKDSIREMPVPEGVSGDPESLEDAVTLTSATRTRICLNGLWQSRPALADDLGESVPDALWGWYKLPAVLGTNHQLPIDCPAIRAYSLASRRKVVWYRRRFEMPRQAAAKRVVLSFEMVSTRVCAFVDGKMAGETTFPSGQIDITRFVRPGQRQTLALYVTAYPADRVTRSYNAPDRAAEESQTKINLPGVTGDLWLDLEPMDVRLREPTVRTSVSRGEATFVARVEGFSGPGRLTAVVTGCGETRQFESGQVTPGADGRVSFTASWPDAKLWDADVGQNLYDCRLAFRDGSGRVLDETVPFRFGFREVAVRGRDLLVNGKRVHLRVVTCPLPCRSPAVCNRETAREYVRRVRETGVNCVIGGNYGFAEGAVGNIESILSVFDEEGLFYSFSMPHFKDFTGGGPFRGEDEKARYRALVEKVVRMAENHPCVITYAASHNRTGYIGGQHPLNMDGRYEVPEVFERQRKVRATALVCGEIISSCDPTRPVYHHESGNLGAFHTSNTYLNWVPVQERGEWVADWSARGTKPLMFVEWGEPHVASWSSNREKNLFIWTKPAFQSLWGSEFAAAFWGDAAYAATPEERRCLAREESLWAAGKPFLFHELSTLFYDCTNNFQGVQALHAADNLRVHRAYGVTMECPWDQNQRYQRVRRREARMNPARFDNLKRPGPVCDQFLPQEGYYHDCGERTDWRRNAVGDAFARWWRPFVGWIGGGEHFTDRRHVVRPGVRLSQQLVLTNDRCRDAEVRWRVRLTAADGSVREVTNGMTRVESGTTCFVPYALETPRTSGRAKVEVSFWIGTAEEPSDSMTLDVLPNVSAGSARKSLVYDPPGETRKLFGRLGLEYAETDLRKVPDASETLVIGRKALSRELMDRIVRPFAVAGGRAIVFEQSQSTLEDLGFRVQTYGLRQVFPRFRDARFSLLREDLLRDWAGEATLVEPYFPRGDAVAEYDYTDVPWAGYMNRHAWRCRNRGNVATVLPEKPSRGDWKALCDGGFDLQYAPLLEQGVGAGSVTFCQLDVTARTAEEPMADEIVRALVVGSGPRSVRRRPVKALGGGAIRAVRDHLVWQRQEPEFLGNDAFVVSTGAIKPKDFNDKVRAGARVLLLGLSAEEVRTWSPVPVSVSQTNDCFYSRICSLPPELNGLSNGDWAWHGTMSFAAFDVSSPEGNEALRIVRYGKGVMVFWQVPPDRIDDHAKPYLRTSRRRAEAMLARLMANLGFSTDETGVHYADAPLATDDPYRFERW